MTERRRRVLLVALSAGGFAFLAVQLVVGWRIGLFGFPGGDIVIWDRAGDALRAGLSPYVVVEPRNETFWYAPPFAVLFALVSWLPPIALWAGMFAANLLGLWYLGGSLRGVGLICWFPFLAFELFAANINICIAAGIVAAVRGRPEIAAFTAFAKLAPMLAVDPRDWRRAGAVVLVALAVTLPVVHLWPEWIRHLAAAYGQPLGPQVAIAFPIRAAFALGLLALRRPWSRAGAAVVAMPAFYWGSFVLFLAPLVAWMTARYAIRATDGLPDRPTSLTPEPVEAVARP